MRKQSCPPEKLSARSHRRPLIEWFPARCGVLTCRVRGENGSWITYHSRYDPEAEARRLMEGIEVKAGRLVVLVGLGLGYGLIELARQLPAQHPILVIEKNREVFEIAQPLLEESLTTQASVQFLVAQEIESVLQTVSRLRLKQSLSDLCLVLHPPSLEAFPSYYRPLAERLSSVRRSPLKQALEYKRFSGQTIRVLLFDRGYIMGKELVRAFSQAGHEVSTLDIRRRNENFIECLLSTLLSFKPDFILTINHLGFDEDGKLTELLTSLKVPFAVWYVDSPDYILKHSTENASPFCTIFCWEKSYLSKLKKLGFESPVYLPLATDPELFHPLPETSPELERYLCPVSFVGNSMAGPVREWEARVQWDEKKRLLAAQAVVRQKRERRIPIDQILMELAGTGGSWEKDFEAALVWRATYEYRLKLVRQLAPFGLYLYGDSEWEGIVKGVVQVRPKVDYYGELCRVYNASEINFNATSFQMNTAVNQRVFDVAACGAFLMTDLQVDLEELFDVGRETVCYESAEDLSEKVRYYLNHPGQRREVAQRARKRVLRSHTYERRVAQIVKTMRSRYGTC